MYVFDCWANGNLTEMSIIDYFDKPSEFGGNELRQKYLTVKTKDYQKADEEQREFFFESLNKSYTFAVKCGRIMRVEKKLHTLRLTIKFLFVIENKAGR